MTKAQNPTHNARNSWSVKKFEKYRTRSKEEQFCLLILYFSVHDPFKISLFLILDTAVCSIKITNIQLEKIRWIR